MNTLEAKEPDIHDCFISPLWQTNELKPILLLTAAVLCAEPRRFDTYTFNAPDGYSANEARQQFELVKKDLTRRTFCQFILQQAQPSLGSAQQDLDAEWNIVVAKEYSIKSAPLTREIEVPGAPQSIVRSANTSYPGVGPVFSSLTLVRLSGRYVGVLLNASNLDAASACQSDAAAIITSIRLTATALTPAPLPTTTSAIPIGNTPQQFPGSPGWLPSGTGLPVPDPSLDTGKPVGLWWKMGTNSAGVTNAEVHIFLENGIRASNPRPGGPRLFDWEGQTRQLGVTGVGTFAIEGGQFIQRYDGFENKGTYATGADSSGPFFKSGSSVFRPLTEASPQTISGVWRGPQSQITFRSDGTFLFGSGASASGRSGRYRLEGYLLHLLPDNGPAWIDRVGIDGETLLLGSKLQFRAK